MARVDDLETSVEFRSASVKSVSIKKGEITVVMAAPLDEANATIGDLSNLSSGVFKGTVRIKGKQAQLPLVIPDKPPD